MNNKKFVLFGNNVLISNLFYIKISLYFILNFFKMGKHTKLGSSRLDHYYFLAKSMGFRARSAFKIL